MFPRPAGKIVVLSHHSSLRNGIEHATMSILLFLYILFNTIISEYKNCYLFNLSAKSSLLDCYKEDKHQVWKRVQERLICLLEDCFKTVFQSHISLIYHSHFGAGQLTTEIKLTNGEDWTRFFLFFFFYLIWITKE